MDKDVLILGSITSQNTPIIVFKPSVDGILVKDRILNTQLELVAQEGASSACVDNHTNGRVYLIMAYGKVDPWLLWLRKVHTLYADPFINRCT